MVSEGNAVEDIMELTYLGNAIAEVNETWNNAVN
jgi:hypothetical protein